MDVEEGKSSYVTNTFTVDDHASSSSSDPKHNTSRAHVRQNSVIQPRGILGHLRYYEALLDRKLGIEGSGPERVLPEDRKPPRAWMMALVWASGTMNLSCFVTGFLGWEFGLSLKQSVLTMIFGTFLGSCITVRLHLVQAVGIPRTVWDIF